MPRVKVRFTGKIDHRYPWMNEEMRLLFVDLAKAEGFREIAEFLRDLLTDNEMRMLAQRWCIARAIWSTETPYRDLAEEIETSVATITRVAHRVWYGCGGFKRILERVLPKKLTKNELEKKMIEEEERRRVARGRKMPRSSKFAKKMF